MIDLNSIKLVVWDLDECFWQGTLSSSEPIRPVQENLDAVRKLTDAGIINSICSKNDYSEAKAKLIELGGIWDFFVFPSIDWTPKGERLRKNISLMKLRPNNVLFIDDNAANLNEAKFYMPEIKLLKVEELPDLYAGVEKMSRSDAEHRRLEQYKILERKENFRLITPPPILNTIKDAPTNNEKFLQLSEIKIALSYDCRKNIDRITELVHRTNQLNYTKRRDTKEQLLNLTDDKNYESAAVYVKDRFGDYGCVGFYCLNKIENRLEHFLFSCRILGMSVEKFIYKKLNCPKLETVGEVANSAESEQKITWIKEIDFDKYESETSAKNEQKNELPKILLKGPCDLSGIFPILQSVGEIDAETNYVNEKGVQINHQNNTVHILESVSLNEEQINEIVNDVPFLDKGSFETKILSSEYKVVVLSTLSERYNIYRNRQNGIRVAFANPNDLTNEKNWKNFISKEFWPMGVDFTVEQLKHFKENYEFEGSLSPEETLENIKKIRKLIDEKVLLILLLGSEAEFPGCNDYRLSVTRKRRSINRLLEKEFGNSKNTQLINYTKYVKSESDYLSPIDDHFQRHIYFEMADDIKNVINDYFKNNILKVKPSEITALMWGTGELYGKLSVFYQSEVERGNLKIVGYGVLSENQCTFYDKPGGQIISPDNFQIVIVSSDNFYGHVKTLNGFGIDGHFIIDGRVFQMPNFNFPRFCENGTALGSLNENNFSDTSCAVYTRIFSGEKVLLVLGRESSVSNVSFAADTFGEVAIGNYTTVEQNTIFKFGINEENYCHRVSSYSFKYGEIIRQRIQVGSDVRIGVGTIIISDKPETPLVIGNGAIIKPGSVIVENVPPYAIVGGNPAKIIKYRFSKKIIEELQKIQWWNLPIDKIYEHFQYFSQPTEFTDKIKSCL